MSEHQPARLSGSLPGQQVGWDAAPAQVTQAIERTCSGSGPVSAIHCHHQDLGLLIPTLHTVVLQVGPPGHSLEFSAPDVTKIHPEGTEADK